MRAAFLFALLFGLTLLAYEFRYEHILASQGYLIRVHRFTGVACYVSLNVGFERAADQVMTIPKC